MAKVMRQNLGRISLDTLDKLRKKFVAAGFRPFKEYHRGAEVVVETIYSYSVKVMGKTYNGTLRTFSVIYPREQVLTSLVTASREGKESTYTDDSLIEKLGGERVELGA